MSDTLKNQKEHILKLLKGVRSKMIKARLLVPLPIWEMLAEGKKNLTRRWTIIKCLIQSVMY